MVLSSNDSSDYFENNTPANFMVQLNRQLQFDGYWVVALTEFSTNSWTSDKTSDVYVCCDVCQESFFGTKELPLLRRVFLGSVKENNTVYTTPYYVPMKVGQMQQIRVYITDRDGNLVSFLDGPVNVTLHFKKFPYVS